MLKPWEVCSRWSTEEEKTQCRDWVVNLAAEFNSGRLPVMFIDGIEDLDDGTPLREMQYMHPPFEAMWVEYRMQVDAGSSELQLGGVITTKKLEAGDEEILTPTLREGETLNLEKDLVITMFIFGCMPTEEEGRGRVLGPEVECHLVLSGEDGRVKSSKMHLGFTNEEKRRRAADPDSGLRSLLHTFIRSACVSFSLLSCSNVTIEKSPILTDHDATRRERKERKRAPIEYHVVKVKHGHQVVTLGDGSVTRESPALHRVRGHYRRYWCGPDRSRCERKFILSFLRGNPERGEIRQSWDANLKETKGEDA